MTCIVEKAEKPSFHTDSLEEVKRQAVEGMALSLFANVPSEEKLVYYPGTRIMIGTENGGRSS
jgi:hypothetical protein